MLPSSSLLPSAAPVLAAASASAAALLQRSPNVTSGVMYGRHDVGRKSLPSDARGERPSCAEAAATEGGRSHALACPCLRGQQQQRASLITF